MEALDEPRDLLAAELSPELRKPIRPGQRVALGRPVERAPFRGAEPGGRPVAEGPDCARRVVEVGAGIADVVEMHTVQVVALDQLQHDCLHALTHPRAPRSGVEPLHPLGMRARPGEQPVQVARLIGTRAGELARQLTRHHERLRMRAREVARIVRHGRQLGDDVNVHPGVHRDPASVCLVNRQRERVESERRSLERSEARLERARVHRVSAPAHLHEERVESGRGCALDREAHGLRGGHRVAHDPEPTHFLEAAGCTGGASGIRRVRRHGRTRRPRGRLSDRTAHRRLGRGRHPDPRASGREQEPEGGARVEHEARADHGAALHARRSRKKSLSSSAERSAPTPGVTRHR